MDLWEEPGRGLKLRANSEEATVAGGEDEGSLGL